MSTPPSLLSELDCLQITLNQAIDVFREELTIGGLPTLSNYTSRPHPLDNVMYLPSEKLYEARKLAIAAMTQLKHLLVPPFEKAIEDSFAPFDAACLDIAIRTGIIDVLAAADESSTDLGLHIRTICEKLPIRLDLSKLTPVLRYLAVQGWLREVKEDVYTLTRSALILRRGEFGRDWALNSVKSDKLASSLLDAITHLEWRHSKSHAHTAFQLAYGTPLPMFGWMNEHPEELVAFAKAVKSFGHAEEPGILNDYPWRKFDIEGHTIIDCGGGQGYLTIALSKMLHDARFIIQDLPQVVKMTRKNVEREVPGALEQGKIAVESHDFMTPQNSRAGSSTYVFRYVLHDWSDEDCIHILKNTCLKPGETILILDYVAIPHQVPGYEEDSATGGNKPTQNGNGIASNVQESPAYIPADFGGHAKTSLALGLSMLGVCNALERSLTEWTNLIRQAGLEITKVYSLRAKMSVIECNLPVEA